MAAKIYIADIETAPLVVRTWSVWGANIQPINVFQDRSIICIAWKELGSKRVHSSCVGPDKTERQVVAEFRAAVAKIDYSSASAKINLALSELPSFTCLPSSGVAPHHHGTIHISPTLDYIETAYEDAHSVRSAKPRRKPVAPVIPTSSVGPGEEGSAAPADPSGPVQPKALGMTGRSLGPRPTEGPRDDGRTPRAQSNRWPSG